MPYYIVAKLFGWTLHTQAVTHATYRGEVKKALGGIWQMSPDCTDAGIFSFSLNNSFVELTHLHDNNNKDSCEYKSLLVSLTPVSSHGLCRIQWYVHFIILFVVVQIWSMRTVYLSLFYGCQNKGKVKTAVWMSSFILLPTKPDIHMHASIQQSLIFFVLISVSTYY